MTTHRTLSLGVLVCALSVLTSAGVPVPTDEQPRYSAELVFPLHPQHNHAPAIVECRKGDLLVSWYRGRGEVEACGGAGCADESTARIETPDRRQTFPAPGLAAALQTHCAAVRADFAAAVFGHLQRLDHGCQRRSGSNVVREPAPGRLR